MITDLRCLAATADSVRFVCEECAEPTEPVEVVNEAIARSGGLPRLAPGVSLHLVNSLVSPASKLGRHPVGDILAIPRPSHLLSVEASS